MSVSDAEYKRLIEEARSRERRLLDGKVVLRPDSRGQFDELLLMDGEECVVHAEMMDDRTLWIGIYPKGEKKRRVVMWVGARGNKLNVRAEED